MGREYLSTAHYCTLAPTTIPEKQKKSIYIQFPLTCESSLQKRMSIEPEAALHGPACWQGWPLGTWVSRVFPPPPTRRKYSLGLDCVQTIQSVLSTGLPSGSLTCWCVPGRSACVTSPSESLVLGLFLARNIPPDSTFVAGGT